MQALQVRKAQQKRKFKILNTAHLETDLYYVGNLLYKTLLFSHNIRKLVYTTPSGDPGLGSPLEEAGRDQSSI